MENKQKRHILSYVWLPALVALVIFYLSCLAKPDDMPPIDWGLPIEIDKVVHFCMYFGLAGVASFNYIYLNKGKIIILKMLFWAILTPIVYGGIVEILQANFFEREGDWMDFLANTLGALSTIPFSLWLRKHMLLSEQEKQNI